MSAFPGCVGHGPSCGRSGWGRGSSEVDPKRLLGSLDSYPHHQYDFFMLRGVEAHTKGHDPRDLAQFTFARRVMVPR